MYDFLYEVTGEQSAMESHSIHIYSHLMKCYTHSNYQNGNNISGTWINTIYTQCEKFNKAVKDNASTFRRIFNDDVSLKRIKRKAIEEYIDDTKSSEKDATKVYDAVHVTFPTLNDLLDWEKLKSYIMSIAVSIKDSKAIDILNNK